MVIERNLINKFIFEESWHFYLWVAMEALPIGAL
jgi:hypothetical protein